MAKTKESLLRGLASALAASVLVYMQGEYYKWSLQSFQQRKKRHALGFLLCAVVLSLFAGTEALKVGKRVEQIAGVG